MSGLTPSKIKICDRPGSSVALEVSDLRILVNPKDDSVFADRKGKYPLEWECFKIEEVGRKYKKQQVYLRSLTGQYLGARPDRSLYTTPNRDLWEQFELERIDGNNIFHIITAHGQYLFIGYIDAPEICCLTDEKIIEVCDRPDSVALKNCYGAYIVVDPHNNTVRAREPGDGVWDQSWESFKIEDIGHKHGNRQVYLKSVTGQYLGASPEGSVYVSL